MGYYKKSDTTHKAPLPEPPIPLSNQFLPLSFICSGGSLYKMYQKEKTEREGFIQDVSKRKNRTSESEVRFRLKPSYTPSRTCRSRLQDVSLAPNRSRAGQRGRPPLRERTGVDDDCVARLKPMARRVVESATLRGHDACARLRVFAVARGTKASQRIYDVYVGNAGSEHYPRGWARRRAVMQKRVRRLPDVLGRTQQSPPRITLSTWA